MRILAFLLLPALFALQAQDTMLFQAPHHDFGRITHERLATHRFKAHNQTKFPVQIKQVLPSCGCTSTVAGQWYLKPDESTELEVSFDPKGFIGAVHKSVHVIGEIASDPPTPFSQVLSFEAQVQRGVMPSTSTLFFQGMSRTATRKATLILASGDNQPVKVTRMEIPGAPYLSTSMRQDGMSVEVTVTFDGKRVPIGHNNGVNTLAIQTTHPQTPYVYTNIQWDLRARINTTPERLAWVDNAGKELSAKLTLNHADNRPFRVLKGTCTSPHIKVEGLNDTAAVAHELRVVLAPSARSGVMNEWLTLETDDPEQPELKLRVTAVLR